MISSTLSHFRFHQANNKHMISAILSDFIFYQQKYHNIDKLHKNKEQTYKYLCTIVELREKNDIWTYNRIQGKKKKNKWMYLLRIDFRLYFGCIYSQGGRADVEGCSRRRRMQNRRWNPLSFSTYMKRDEDIDVCAGNVFLGGKKPLPAIVGVAEGGVQIGSGFVNGSGRTPTIIAYLEVEERDASIKPLFPKQKNPTFSRI